MSDRVEKLITEVVATFDLNAIQMSDEGGDFGLWDAIKANWGTGGLAEELDDYLGRVIREAWGKIGE